MREALESLKTTLLAVYSRPAILVERAAIKMNKIGLCDFSNNGGIWWAEAGYWQIEQKGRKS